MKYLFFILVLVLSLMYPGDAIADDKSLGIYAQPQQVYTLISGVGTHHHQVSTSNPKAIVSKRLFEKY